MCVKQKCVYYFSFLLSRRIKPERVFLGFTLHLEINTRPRVWRHRSTVIFTTADEKFSFSDFHHNLTTFSAYATRFSDH